MPRRRRASLPSGSASKAACSRACASSWRPRKCSDAAHAAVRRSCAARSSLADHLERCQQALARRREVAGGPLGRRELGRQLEPAPLSSRGHEPQRGGVPPRRGLGRARLRCRGGLGQRRDRVRVTLDRRVLDVVRALQRRRAPRLHRAAARPCADSRQPGPRRLVHGAPDQGMAKREAPRDRGRVQELGVEQLVQRSRPRRPDRARRPRMRARARTDRQRSLPPRAAAGPPARARPAPRAARRPPAAAPLRSWRRGRRSRCAPGAADWPSCRE